MSQLLERPRRRLLRPVGVFAAAVPVAFGVVRAITTGDDFRYLWLAAAAILGSLAVMWPGSRAPRPARVTALRGVGAIVSGAVCAAAAALVQGATLGLGLAIVAVGFGICTGTGAVLVVAARQQRVR